MILLNENFLPGSLGFLLSDRCLLQSLLLVVPLLRYLNIRELQASVLRFIIFSNCTQVIWKSTPNWKDWCWRWNSNPLATWFEETTRWKRPWCWERLRAGGEEGNRGWDGWMASPTQWTSVWANSGKLKDREGSRAAVHGGTKNQTWLSDWMNTWFKYRPYTENVYPESRSLFWTPYYYFCSLCYTST